MAGEKSPLLSEPSLAYGVPAAGPTKEPREFKGRWWHLFGDCSPADVSASCLAIHAPAVAYGWNAQRGLGLKWWKEALKLMLLTCGVFALIRVSLVVLVETQCPDVVHGRLGHGGPRAEPWLEPRQGADGAVLPKPVDAAQAFPVDDPRPRPEDGDGGRPRPRHDDDDDDDDDDNEHRGPHDHDHPFPRPDGDRNGTDPHGDHPRPFPDHDDNHTHPHPHGDDHHEHGHWWPHHHHHHHDHEHRHWGDRFDDDDDDDMPPLTQEEREALRHCALRVGPWAILLVSVGVTAFGYAVYIAALRRRMLRERFGIEGSFKHDVLLWLGCSPCALAQETRTLMYNHVEEGLWHGPLVAAAPRQVQPMTA